MARKKFKDSPEVAQQIGTALTERSSFEPDVDFSVGRVLGRGVDGALEVVGISN